ncbi:MAG: VOC family protein [Candidatus Acidiferrum sp.]
MTDPASHSTGKLRSISPCFLVEDVVKTAEYYRDVLGFHFDRYWGEPPCFVILLRDSIEGCIPRPNRKVHAEAPWDAYVWVTDITLLQKELESKGAKITRGPEDTFYQTREIEIADCNGYVICFGQDTSG